MKEGGLGDFVFCEYGPAANPIIMRINLFLFAYLDQHRLGKTIVLTVKYRLMPYFKLQYSLKNLVQLSPHLHCLL